MARYSSGCDPPSRRQRRDDRGSITSMGYKLLGYIVWNIGKWYARRRANEARRGIAVAAIAGLVLAGVAAAARQRAAH
jgi:uncharacterized membrane protein YiaA